MASEALNDWLGPRAARIDQLNKHHDAVSGSSRGRRWQTGELNWALVLLLAAEFQGFCRELHNLTADEFAARATPQLAVREVIRDRMIEGRQLDRGNAQSSSLGSDFGRFGLDLWTTLKTSNPHATTWRARLDALNEARNGIAHADPARISMLATQGYPLTQIRTIKKFRNTLDRLTLAMDDLMADHIVQLLEGPGPW